ncbi:substrate-binding domain-containing protein [Serinibacter salmoneus]|uniref:GntR family transcriptional regulator n=1 Tax=Serinibacter salmoneus TaxID=556530 RepID=A0A2A9CXE4_9MICO|nr:substrate-binding domain-containing protein [Serinibacter salmoneus]PFG19073.1 GntR family transcriptional regulator [Serinibacter salmoneus]
MSDDDARPLAASRRAEVLAAVQERGTIRVTDLARELGVTAVTVRRDVSALAAQGLVRRVHGGAAALERAAGEGDGTGASSAPTAQASSRGARASAASPGASMRPAHAPDAAGGIGVLVPSLDYYWPTVAKGAEEEAVAHGMRFLLRGSVYDSADERPHLERLLDAGARALLMAPTLRGAGGDLIRPWLEEAPCPVVLMERQALVGAERRPVESVVTDHASGAATAVYHLASLGHRRIGAVLSAESPHVGLIRAGWLRALDELGLQSEPLVDAAIPGRDEPGFRERADEVLQQVQGAGVTALLVHSDPEAIGLMQRWEEHGVEVPRDLSLVSYDDEVATMATPALTAIRPPRRTIGRTAVSLALARLADPGRPAHRVTVSPTLYARGSTRRLEG